MLSGGGDFGPASLREHIERYGPPPSLGRGRSDRAAFVDVVERSGLRGRGGGGFPTGVKLRAVAGGRRRPVVVANGAEGEPLSAKDKVMLTTSPHLVLDGAVLAASALRAADVIVVVDRTARDARVAVENAIEERHATRLDPVSIRIVDSPTRYLAGEESALVHWLNGGPAKPTLVPPRPFERGVGGRPTLVQNVETLAHMALIARFGDAWFRSIGSRSEPGSALVTVGGAVADGGVLEISLGTRVATVIEAAGGVTEEISAFLIGGYFGTWLDAADGWDLALSNEGARGGGWWVRLWGGRGAAGDELRTPRDGRSDAVSGRGNRGSMRTVRARVGCDRASDRIDRARRVRPGDGRTAPAVDWRRGGSGCLPLPGWSSPFRRQRAGCLRRRNRPSRADHGCACAPEGARTLLPSPGASRVGLAMTIRIRVDPIACDGHGVCAELFPERIRLDDWGYPILDPTPIPSELRDHAQRAVTACPKLALALRKDS